LGWVVREGVGGGGRNYPNIVCTYELKNVRQLQNSVKFEN
jgi:hypothetical protein